MKHKKRLLLLLLALLLTLSCVALPTAATEGNEARRTRKVVSVVYDNSGSMQTSQRYVYAKYSIQMLMAMLGEEDELFITPLNKGNSLYEITGIDDGVVVDLSAKNRGAEVKRVLSDSFLQYIPMGTTPEDSIPYAIDRLVSGGLKDRDQMMGEEEDTEYWLVFLSDGTFDGVSVSEAVEANIDKYPSLKTIFIAFGQSAPAFATVAPLMKKYQFTYYSASVKGETAGADSKDIADVIQSVANQLSGRLPLKSNVITTAGNTVKVNLDACDYGVKSVSVIAQNCGAKLLGAKHKGSEIDILLPCEISPAGTPLKAGYTATVEGDPYLQGGMLEFEFSAPVNQVSVMVEPALSIRTYLERKVDGKWERTDMQTINAEMSGGEYIRAGFEVFDQQTGKQIDLKSIFGETVADVTYAGARYKIGQDIPLVVGNNVLEVSVSVMDGAFKMYSPLHCIIEATPEHYRVESKLTDNSKPGSMKAEVEYTVYINNKPAGKADLKNYTYKAELVSPSGDIKPLTCNMGSDGKIKTSASLSSGEFGSYCINFIVTSEYKLSRDASDAVGFYPEEMSVTVKGQDSLSLSQYGITNNNSPFVFELKSGGKAFDFANDIIAYTVTVDGKDVTSHATVKDNVLTYVPRGEHFGNGISPGSKKVVVTVTCPAYPALTASAEAGLHILSTAFTVEAVDAGNKEVDRFDIDGSNAVIYFRILRDGVPLPKDELETALGEVKFSEPGVLSWMFWLPGGSEISVEELNGEAVISYRVVENWKKLSFDFMAMFILNGEKTVEATYGASTASDSVVFVKSTFGEYALPVVIFLLLVWILAWLVGFIQPWGLAKNFPRGMFVVISPAYSDNDPPDIYVEPLEKKGYPRWRWHWVRLNPFRMWMWRHHPTKAIDDFEISCDKKGDCYIAFTADGYYPMTTYPKPKKAYLDRFLTECEEALKKRRDAGEIIVPPELKTKDTFSFFAKQRRSVVQGEKMLLDGTAYGYVDDSTQNNSKVVKIVFFVNF